MADDALDIALGLWRVPALRAALRARPLPDDVGTLIELASGVPLQLRNAARRSGETEARLLEAARFYVREVLVFDGADAWRVLGTPPGASVHVLKSHKRWLQHWLHPDRNRAAGDAIHATRVNAAWAQLRTAERRAAYSADVAEHGADEADRRGAQRIVVTGWRAVPGQAVHPRRHWIGIGAAALACAGLLVLVVRKANEPAPEWPGTAAVAATGPALRRPPRELAPSGPAEAASWRRVAVQARVRETATAPGVRHDVPRPPRDALVTQPRVRQSIREAVGASPALDVVAGNARQLVPAIEPSPVRSRARARPGRILPAAPPVATTAPKRDAGGASHASGPPPPVTSAATADLDLQRATLAQRRGTEVTQYLLAKTAHVPPIWHSGNALDEATAIREQVGSRIGAGHGQPRFAPPRWSIDRERAVMTADLVGSGPDAARGTLQVELAWRHEMWLVDHIRVVGL